MRHFNFEKISDSELMAVYNHHASILERAAKIRVLNDSEMAFISLLPMLECKMISMVDFRKGCKSYFEN